MTLFRKPLAITTVVFLLGCHASVDTASQSKDIATNLNISDQAGPTYLYYVERDLVWRTTCPEASLLRDRVHCVENQRVVPVNPFLSTISAGVSQLITERELAVQALYVKIATIDNQLIALIAAGGQDATEIEQVRQQLSLFESKKAELQIRSNETDSQISIIEKKLATEKDSDLRLQLTALQDKRLQFKNELQAQESKLVEIRKTFVAAHGLSVNALIFNGQKKERDFYSENLTEATKSFEEALNSIQGLTILSRGDVIVDVMSSQGFFDTLKPVVRLMTPTFDRLLEELVHIEWGPNAFSTSGFWLYCYEYGSPQEAGKSFELKWTSTYPLGGITLKFIGQTTTDLRNYTPNGDDYVLTKNLDSTVGSYKMTCADLWRLIPDRREYNFRVQMLGDDFPIESFSPYILLKNWHF